MKGMSRLNEFIEHSNVAEILAALEGVLTPDPITQQRGMLMLAGLPKTGKDRIVRHWIQRLHTQEQREQIGTHQVLLVADMWDPKRVSLGSTVYVTPITCVLFTEIVYSLGEMSMRLGPSYTSKTWYR